MTMSEIFSQRREQLDWQLIAEIEPMLVTLGAPEELTKLHRILESVAFCNIENEFTKVWFERLQKICLGKLRTMFKNFIQASNTINSNEHFSRRHWKAQEDWQSCSDYPN